MPLIQVGLHFGITRPKTPLHDALLAVREISVEAPTSEIGEHYVNQIMEALERESDRQ